MSYYMQKNNMSFPSPSQPVSPSSSSSSLSIVITKCTKPCHHGVCLMSDCTFAHSIEELNPIPCVYNERCVNERCNRFHPSKGETVQQYANKNNFVFPSPPSEQKIEEEKRIIIHFEPEEYEIVYEDVYEDDIDILEILRREDGDENDENDSVSSSSSSPSLEDMIQSVSDEMAAMIPRSVYLLPYDKACNVMSNFLQEMELCEMTMNNVQICA